MTLEVSNVHGGYGPIQVLKDVSFSVGRGEIVALIGSNGAGKTTTLRAISGLVPISMGRILWNNQSLTAIAPYDIVLRGVAHVPEGRQVFGNLSVRENLLMGAYRKREKQSVTKTLEKVLELFPRLRERHKQLARHLSGGEQQMLALGRALMSSPQLLLLDEPSMGLAPIVADQIFDAIEKISVDGTSILLVEQNIEIALRLARRAYVLRNGKIVKSGFTAELQNDDLLREAFLGKNDTAIGSSASERSHSS